jgi:hypothetical protein
MLIGPRLAPLLESDPPRGRDAVPHLTHPHAAPGDLLATGTPPGVSYARTPPWLPQPGDVVEVEVARLGILRNTIVGAEHRT